MKADAAAFLFAFAEAYFFTCGGIAQTEPLFAQTKPVFIQTKPVFVQLKALVIKIPAAKAVFHEPAGRIKPNSAIKFLLTFWEKSEAMRNIRSEKSDNPL